MVAAVPLGAGAQGFGRDAWVSPPGTVHAGVGLDYTHFDRRFAGAGTEPWSADLQRPLTAINFAPLAAVRARLDDFLAATGGGGPVAAESLSLGIPELAVSADSRTVPMEIGIGILPRVEVGLTVPIFRSELQVSRFQMSGGSVGGNPAPAENAAALGVFGAEHEELGRSALLPLASSPLGEELRRRAAAAGRELVLPTAPPASDSLLNAILMAELGLPPLASYREPWRLGDVEASVRVRVLSTFDDAPFPTDSAGLDYRLTATAGARFPTGSEPDTLRLLGPSRAVGLSGWSAGVAGDVFVGRRLWVGVAVGYTAARTTDVLRRVTPPHEPFASPEPPQAVRWSPPAELRIRVSPRLRLEEAVAVGLDYEMLGIGPSRFEAADGAADVLSTPGGSVQRFGASVRFSTLAGRAPGSGALPMDAALSYSRTFAGPSRHPTASTLSVQARLYHRLWGR